jgi:hypothetical protein
MILKIFLNNKDICKNGINKRDRQNNGMNILFHIKLDL